MLSAALKRKRSHIGDEGRQETVKPHGKSVPDINADNEPCEISSVDAYSQLLQLSKTSSRDKGFTAGAAAVAAGSKKIHSSPSNPGAQPLPPHTCHAEFSKLQFGSEVTRPIEIEELISEAVTVEGGTIDFYRSHFEKVLTREIKAELGSKKSKRFKKLDTDGWQPSQIRLRSRIEATSVSYEQGKIDAPMQLEAYGIKPRLQGTFALLHRQDEKRNAQFPAQAEAAAFALCNRYLDFLHMCHPYATSADELSAEESATLLHVTNHIMKKMDTVKKNNQGLAANSVDKCHTCDQGFVRPTVLLLVPMRCIALTIALRFVSLAQRESRHDSIQGKELLLKDYSAEEGSGLQKDVKRPSEHKALFSNTNTDDHFCLGIKVTRGAVKLFTPLYESDVVIASPLALATKIAEVDKGDILSSIEVAIVYRADIMLMQNWAHVETVFQALNKMPLRQHDIDIMRVRPYLLEECAKMYRQTIIFSSFEAPEMNGLTKMFCNHEGTVRIGRKYDGVLDRIVPQVHHLFQKVAGNSHQDAIEQRFQHFVKHVWTRIADARAPGVVLFVSSYYDFVRERKVLLYTERAHFYFRPTLRGVHEVVFYSLPQHADFYQELVNMAKPRSADLFCSVQALVSKYDYLAIKRIVGSKRAKRMETSGATSFLFKTD